MLTVLWENAPVCPAQRTLLERLCAAARAAAHTPPSAEVTVLLTDDARLHALNRAYRGKDTPADVLSFPQQDRRLREDAGCKPALPEDDAGYEPALPGDDAGYEPTLPAGDAGLAAALPADDVDCMSALPPDDAGGNSALRAKDAGYKPALPEREEGRNPGLPEEDAGVASAPPDGGEYLGDIAISLPRVHAQAAAYGHSAERELAYLFVHGFLHLLGHTHYDDTAYTHMRAQEEAILKVAGLPRLSGTTQT